MVVVVVVVDVVVIVGSGGVLLRVELPAIACRHFLLSQQPLGHVILLLFRVKLLQNGLRHRKRPLRVLFGIHLHLSSDPFPRLTISEPCNYDKMILSVQTTAYFFLVPFQKYMARGRSKLHGQDEVGRLSKNASFCPRQGRLVVKNGQILST